MSLLVLFARRHLVLWQSQKDSDAIERAEKSTNNWKQKKMRILICSFYIWRKRFVNLQIFLHIYKLS